MALQRVYQYCEFAQGEFIQLGTKLYIRNTMDLSDSGIPIIFNDDIADPYKVTIRVNDIFRFYRNDIERFGTIIFIRGEEYDAQRFCIRNPTQIVVWDIEYDFGNTLTYSPINSPVNSPVNTLTYSPINSPVNSPVASLVDTISNDIITYIPILYKNINNNNII